ncbi:alpha/beta fold hydrolase [[Mycoplasma] testudinis]|uniref:alpha/beta fold hydrolase n=1 Tax=[Mycoplasma] testudinis TaxID=33924 RepID=UPI0004812D6E|nr:alpha/beta hydrolase [[Mycoplasma] testudinis]
MAQESNFVSTNFREELFEASVDTSNLKPYFQNGWRRKYVIVFVHGFTSDYQSHNSVFYRLKRYGYKYYAFNLPGHGDNQNQSEADMQIENYSKLVSRFIIENNLRNVILVGHSMGGAIAVMVNALISDYIACLVLEDPLNKMVFSLKKERIIKAINAKDPQTGKRFGIIRWFKNMWKNKAEYKPLFKNLVSAKTTRDTEWAYQQIKNKPVLLFFGKQDLVIPPKESIAYITSNASNIEVRIFENGSHSPHNDAPDLYFKYFIDFIKRFKKQDKKRLKTEKRSIKKVVGLQDKPMHDLQDKTNEELSAGSDDFSTKDDEQTN